MIINREVILAKIEATKNQDSNPVASTDAVLVQNPSWALEPRFVERPNVKSNLSTDQALYAGALRKVTFSCEVKGSGAAGTPPEIGALLQACATSESIVASTSVTYEPVSTGHKTVTIYYYQDGLRYIITGAVGDVDFSLESNGSIMANFEFTGHSVAPTDQALVTPNYDSVVPVPLVGLSSLTVNGYAAVINALKFGLGNSIATPTSLKSADGYSDIIITKRDVKGSFDPEHTIVATQDWEGLLRAGTLFAITTGVIGSVAGNRVQFDMDKCYYSSIGPGEREGVRTLENGFRCVENAGEDELTIIFT